MYSYVVCFIYNETVWLPQRTIVPQRTIKFRSVVFDVTLRLLVINTSSTVSSEQQTTPLTSDECYQPRSGAAVCVALSDRSVGNTRWSQILVKNREFCLTHLHSMLPLQGFPSEYYHDVWYEKMVASRWWKKLKICLLISTEYTTDRQTDRRTPHDGIARAYA